MGFGEWIFLVGFGLRRVSFGVKCPAMTKIIIDEKYFETLVRMATVAMLHLERKLETGQELSMFERQAMDYYQGADVEFSRVEVPDNRKEAASAE